MNRHERGSITVMTIGFVTIIGLLLVVVVNASDAYLERQDLSNIADGAALNAADALSADAYYQTQTLALDDSAARVAAADYAARSGARLDSLAIVDDRVQLTVTRRLQLPLVPPGWLGERWIRVDATALLRPGA